MKILTGSQIREADRATAEREPIAAVDLMERASEEIARWIGENTPTDRRLIFCCGKGNNGGDGLAAARMLSNAGFECVIFFGAAVDELSAEARLNLERLPEGIELYDITTGQPEIEPDAVVIDALLGSGVEGEVREPLRAIIGWMNSLPNSIISIDLPSGMSTEWGNADRTIIRAETTLTLEFPKLALLLPEAGGYAGRVVVLPIGLDAEFIDETPSPYYYITEDYADSLKKYRPRFSHKGDYGHAMLVCGSREMIGAAVLAAGGALRSGCGLVTAHVPASERFALQANWPSAILSLDPAEWFSQSPAGIKKFNAIGAGCGLGQRPETAEALGELLRTACERGIPMVLDADALNLIAADSRLRESVPAGAVLTPHPGELRRLVGEWVDDRDKLARSSDLARSLDSVVVVKGAHTAVCTPDGRVLFNSTGNPGMAKGGCGDVLTGFIAGLLARGYAAEEAAALGVYLHGRAGDMAAEYYGEEAMNSADLTEFFQENGD